MWGMRFAVPLRSRTPGAPRTSTSGKRAEFFGGGAEATAFDDGYKNLHLAKSAVLTSHAESLANESTSKSKSKRGFLSTVSGSCSDFH